jgi:hypothetical protein
MRAMSSALQITGALLAQLLQALRCNHALEHATLHVLAQQFPHVMLAGRADARGFMLYGSLPGAAVQAAAHSALQRLRSGEQQLALHPNCGTNLVAAGLLAALAARVATAGTSRSRLARLLRIPLLAGLLPLALLAARPLGYAAQRSLTTSSAMGALRIVSVTRTERAGQVRHRVQTRVAAAGAALLDSVPVGNEAQS